MSSPSYVAARRPATPARRARARRDPAVLLPPAPPRRERDLTEVTLDVVGVPYRLGGSLDADGDQAVELTMEGASTLTLTVSDPDSKLGEALSTEALLLEGGVRCTIDTVVYVLTAANGGGTEQTTSLTFIDETAWRLDQFDSYLSVSRKKSTDGEFVYRLVREASAAPLAPMRAFIPELRQRLPMAAVEQPTTGGRGQPSTRGGLGDSTVTVKRVKAKAPQRHAINGILSRAQQRGASRRVMIAAIMTATQEATMSTGARNGIHVGLFQQNNAYGSVSKRTDPTTATDGFLNEWKRIHGSIKTAPGSLAAAIEAVQRSGQGSLYAAWEAEATKTVDTWLGGDGRTGGSSRTYPKSFPFTRGERNGQRESSWVAIGRMAADEGRRKRRWAALNTLHYVSEDELRAAAPSVTIHGDEAWIVTPPDWEWGAVNRPVTDVTLVVLSERWGVLPGAVVVLAGQDHLDGRYLVSSARDDLRGPETQVTLKRPAPPGKEPAHEIAERAATDDQALPLQGVVGKRVLDQLDGLSPKEIVDRIVLPTARKCGVPRTVAQNNAANAAHGPTVASKRSDHQGPPSYAWAADMSNGGSPTAQMDKLAATLAKMFGIPWSGSGAVSHSAAGFRFQLIYRINTPEIGNHDNHVHFGVRKGG